MFRVQAIRPVSDFSRKPAEHIKRLKETMAPEILTENGKAELVIQDAEAYQEMSDLLESLEAIAKSVREHDEGKGVPIREAFSQLRSDIISKYSNAKI